MAARNWLCTRNNPDILGQEYLEKYHKESQAVYTVGQVEKGEKEETLHLQFFCNFKKPVRMAHLRKVDGKAHYEAVVINNGADNYCMKEKTRVEGPWEFGTKPVKRNCKTDWDEVKRLAKEGNLDLIPAQIYISHYNSLKKIQRDHMKFVDKEHLRGLWIWGEAGVGKSRYARERLKGQAFYPKLSNKWWDGYQGEKHVIMDDFDKTHACLKQHLKHWGDRYGYPLEVKGGTVTDNFDTFTVTSQYSIEQIWPDEPETVDAIRRRFKVLHMTGLKKQKTEVIDASYNY